MRDHSAGQAIQIVSTFQHRHHTTLRIGRCQLENNLGELGKIVVIERELMQDKRYVHLNGTGEMGAPSKLGYSTGRFEDDALIVETTNFIDDPWGSHTGVDSSSEKHLVERFTMSDDGLFLHAEITVTDPVYLSKPHTFKHRWEKLADRPVIQAPCTMEAARLYLEAGYAKEE